MPKHKKHRHTTAQHKCHNFKKKKPRAVCKCKRNGISEYSHSLPRHNPMIEANRHAYRNKKGEKVQLFPINRGKDIKTNDFFQLYDGIGNKLGKLGGRPIPGTSSETRGVKINYRQKKRMTILEGDPAQEKVYVFYYALATLRGSGWIKKEAIKSTHRHHLAGKPINAKPPRDCGGKGFIKNEIVGKVRGAEGSQDQILYERKVVGCSCDPDASERVGDYLTRTNGTVNLLYALPSAGGVSCDSFPIGTTFYSAHRDCIPKEAVVNVYPECSRHPLKKGMNFVYGYVEDNKMGSKRYGWIAKETLKRIK